MTNMILQKFNFIGKFRDVFKLELYKIILFLYIYINLKLS